MKITAFTKEDLLVYAALAYAENFTGLLSTFLAVGQLDPFRDEAIYYV